jgi:starch synthase (maltosyl-transferring)
VPLKRALAVSDAGNARVVVENLAPAVEGGRFAIKRVVGERVDVEADCYADGHDAIACMLRYRHESEKAWHGAEMAPLGNDRWRAGFLPDREGIWRYLVEAAIDPLASWHAAFRRRSDADLPVAALVGADLVEAAARNAAGETRRRLRAWTQALRETPDAPCLRAIAAEPGLLALARSYWTYADVTRSAVEFRVVVDRERARFSTWYEMFPRSAATEPGKHGTFDDVRARLDYVAGMGFDVLYLPPIHPIGRVNRKGANNALVAGDADPGSPWAIGAAEGGHKAIHPALGTLDDFKRLVAAAGERGMEIALDIALQCAPDHPYLAAHPEWFRRRPDGSMQYAENPPKKYEDIVPLDFECAAPDELWRELRGIFLHWAGAGVRIFRVDNPHTKPFRFWEWVIGEVKRAHPDVLFLSEAFTRPRPMHRLAKLGFTQSYTYFTWREHAKALREYFTELAQGEGREYFRPNCWPNTPDILPAHLQEGGLPAFRIRLVLAATLAANYGIYGPAFELGEHVAREPGSEEYRDSEKYQVRHWDLSREDSLAPFIGMVNGIRHANPALQSDWSLRFHGIDNTQLLCYSKRAGDNVVLAVVNLDPRSAQSGWTALELDELGLAPEERFEVHDMLSGTRYPWHGARNYVRLDPLVAPAHIFSLRPTRAAPEAA